MMPHKKTLQLREIQKIANLIDALKGAYDKDGKEISPNYPAKWGPSPQYWMGRLRQFCEPIVNRITETRNELVKQYGTKNDEGGYVFKGENDTEFNAAIKELLDTKETIRFPEFKASQFVKMKGDKNNKEVEESLVPMDFWTIFADYIEMDVKEFQVPKDEEEPVEAEETA